MKENRYVVVQIECQIKEYVSDIFMLQRYIENLKKFQRDKSVNAAQRKQIGIEIYIVQDFIAMLSNKLAGLYLMLTLDENERL